MFGTMRFLDDAGALPTRCYAEAAWGIPRMPEHIPRGADPWRPAQRRATPEYGGRGWRVAGVHVPFLTALCKV